MGAPVRVRLKPDSTHKMKVALLGP
jgi:hypothetical protein